MTNDKTLQAMCELCKQWPRVQHPDWGLTYCAFHNRVMTWWGDSYSSEVHEMEGRRVMALLCCLRDRLRVLWLAETFYALLEGGPFDFWPWSSVTRWWCSKRGHAWPVKVGVAEGDADDPRRWYLWSCPRCNGMAALPDGGSNERAFAARVSYNTIWCGFTRTV